MKAQSKQKKVTERVTSLEVGQHFNKKEFIFSVWGSSNYFIDRSFDVMFSTAKKTLTDRDFVTGKGFIIRTK
jgi:hypothetical protein